VSLDGKDMWAAITTGETSPHHEILHMAKDESTFSIQYDMLKLDSNVDVTPFGAVSITYSADFAPANAHVVCPAPTLMVGSGGEAVVKDVDDNWGGPTSLPTTAASRAPTLPVPTHIPSARPTPTLAPTVYTTPPPSFRPDPPTHAPITPSMAPVVEPTQSPTKVPTDRPSYLPTPEPSAPPPTESPTEPVPTEEPTVAPTVAPSSDAPTPEPSKITPVPTRAPTATDPPTPEPTTPAPTGEPSLPPTDAPSVEPTEAPTKRYYPKQIIESHMQYVVGGGVFILWVVYFVVRYCPCCKCCEPNDDVPMAATDKTPLLSTGGKYYRNRVVAAEERLTGWGGLMSPDDL
jgi:hypothetical protein